MHRNNTTEPTSDISTVAGSSKARTLLTAIFALIACACIVLLASINLDSSASFLTFAAVYGILLAGFIVSLLGLAYLRDPFDFKAHVVAISYLIHDYRQEEADLKYYDDKYTNEWLDFKYQYGFVDRLKIMYSTCVDDYYALYF